MTSDTPAGPLRRFATRAGVRLAVVQALVVIAAFAMAGAMARLSIDRLETEAMRERVQGEVRSLQEEFAQRGADHLPHTLAKRTRLWRGFAYGLVDGAGRRLAGSLVPAPAPGWRARAGHPSDADPARRPFLTFTERLPDGSRLMVGQDLSAQARQSEALTRMLLLCGACGVVFCVGASTIFSLRAWRQVAAMAAVARQVKEGRLAVRVPERRGVAGDDMDDLGVTFNAMLDRIGLLLEQVRQVSTDIAHDLRTPLTRVALRLEALRESVAPTTAVAREVRQVEDDLAEILRTFDALLQLADLGARADVRTHAPFDLGAAAQQVADAYRPDIEEGGRTLVTDCSPALVCGDARLVAQAVSNLLENAMRHTPPGTRVSLKVEPRPQPRLVVADDGPGVPVESRTEVLRPFARLDRSRHLAGSGVGLSVVAAVAARHGARLTLGDAGPGLEAVMLFGQDATPA